MSDFQLDPGLRQDCLILGGWDSSLLLLLNNALVPWFIIVPRTQVTELYELSAEQQSGLQAQINSLSRFLKEQLSVDKINVAAIGNIVSQLHIHVVGRSVGDFCWPGVVWGADKKRPYDQPEVQGLRDKLQRFVGDDLNPFEFE